MHEGNDAPSGRQEVPRANQAAAGQVVAATYAAAALEEGVVHAAALRREAPEEVHEPHGEELRLIRGVGLGAALRIHELALRGVVGWGQDSLAEDSLQGVPRVEDT